MKIFKYFKNAMSSLWRNKLRSALSTLGIVIGIASVSIMMALGEGMKLKMLESLSVSNDVISIIQKYDFGGVPGKDGKPNSEEKAYTQIQEILVEDSIDKILKYIGNISYVIGYGYGNGGGIKFEGKEIYSQTVGITYDYLRAKNIKILSGVGFNKKHFSESAKVALLGNDLIKQDFAGKNPIGKQIMIGGYAFDIIGVLDKSTDYNVNYAIIVPFPTAKVSLGVKTFNNLYIYVKDIQKLQSTKKDVLFLLMKLSGAPSPSEAKFNVESNDEAIKQINETIGELQLFLGGIAGLSLLVGGIGIMNIMLVSVVERTREIGIRKAIGARKGDILLQFLVESVVISILGCLIAFGLTLLGVYLINRFAPEDFSAVFNLNVVIFSSCISIAMGIIFGLLPAWKAAKMRPIDALRFE